MKLILSCLVTMYFPVLSVCQIKTEIIGPKSFFKIELSEDTSTSTITFPIGTVFVIDSRDDTSNLGYSTDHADDNIALNPKKYHFKSSFENEISRWFNTYLKSDGTVNKNTLLVNIKKLLLSSQVVPKKNVNGHAGQANNGWDKGVLTKIEFFLKKDIHFIPLYRFDSIIPIHGILPRDADEFISTALRLSLKKLFTLDLDKVLVLSKKKVLFTQIAAMNKKSTDIPILTGTNYSKGVYRTFMEFKMNQPSLTDYEFKKGEWGDIIYIKENNIEYPLREAWGFSDGKDIFINSGDKYSQLVRSGYTFYFTGIKSLLRSTEIDLGKASLLSAGINNGHKLTKFNKRYKYFQVDMETGEVY